MVISLPDYPEDLMREQEADRMLGLDSRAYNELHSGGTLSGMGGRRPSATKGVWVVLSLL